MFSSQEVRATLNEKIKQLKASADKNDANYRELSKTYWQLSEVLSIHYKLRLHENAQECISHLSKLDHPSEHEIKVIGANETCDTLGINSKLIRECLFEENQTNPKKVTDTVTAIDGLITTMREIKAIDNQWMVILASFGEVKEEGSAGNLSPKSALDHYNKHVRPFDELQAKYGSIAGNSGPITSALLHSAEPEKVAAVLKQLDCVSEDLKTYPKYLADRVQAFVPSHGLRKQKVNP